MTGRESFPSSPIHKMFNSNSKLLSPARVMAWGDTARRYNRKFLERSAELLKVSNSAKCLGLQAAAGATTASLRLTQQTLTNKQLT